MRLHLYAFPTPMTFLGHFILDLESRGDIHGIMTAQHSEVVLARREPVEPLMTVLFPSLSETNSKRECKTAASLFRDKLLSNFVGFIPSIT